MFWNFPPNLTFIETRSQSNNRGRGSSRTEASPPSWGKFVNPKKGFVGIVDPVCPPRSTPLKGRGTPDQFGYLFIMLLISFCISQFSTIWQLFVTGFPQNCPPTPKAWLKLINQHSVNINWNKHQSFRLIGSWKTNRFFHLMKRHEMMVRVVLGGGGGRQGESGW